MTILFRIVLTTVFVVCASSAGADTLSFDRSDAAPGNLRFTWIHGSLSAKANTDVRIQVQRYNEHTYLMRQNPAVHWEAPFMYLLLGNTTAVLLDAGATKESEYFPLRQVVDRVLSRWQDANQISDLQLLVLPLGSDASQLGAIDQFADRPNTRVVPPDVSSRKLVLGDQWPQSGVLDLGGRALEVLPTPGLDATAISVYDTWSDLLFTGNTFYPGRLVIRDFAAYRQSLTRLVAFSKDNPVQWIFGGRIEMSARAGMDYLLRANYRPNERVLQMPPQALLQALQVVSLINGNTDIRILDDFIVMHGVGRGARDYGWPVYIPEQFRSANTR